MALVYLVRLCCDHSKKKKTSRFYVQAIYGRLWPARIPTMWDLSGGCLHVLVVQCVMTMHMLLPLGSSIGGTVARKRIIASF